MCGKTLVGLKPSFFQGKGLGDQFERTPPPNKVLVAIRLVYKLKNVRYKKREKKDIFEGLTH